MLLAGGRLPEEDDGWTFELKWDGCRLQVRCDGTALQLRSRPGRLCSHQFPELQPLAAALFGRPALLDGELVCLGQDGRPDFLALRRRLGARSTASIARVQAEHPIMCMIFDLLYLDDADLCARPQHERTSALVDLALDGPAWQTPQALDGELAAVLAVTAQHGLEGVVAKRADAAYQPGRRSRAWIKYKHRRSEHLQISGYRTDGDGRPETLLLARFGADGRRRYAGEAACKLARVPAGHLSAALAGHAAGPPRRGLHPLRPGLADALPCGATHKVSGGLHSEENPAVRGILCLATSSRGGN
jgi:bifunctional non-homologous end joining protein LigD